MLLSLLEVVQKLVQWTEGCPCHRSQQRKDEEDPQADEDMKPDPLHDDSCILNGRRAGNHRRRIDPVLL